LTATAYQQVLVREGAVLITVGKSELGRLFVLGQEQLPLPAIGVTIFIFSFVVTVHKNLTPDTDYRSNIQFK
jgi:hypothetical protein